MYELSEADFLSDVFFVKCGEVQWSGVKQKSSGKAIGDRLRRLTLQIGANVLQQMRSEKFTVNS